MFGDQQRIACLILIFGLYTFGMSLMQARKEAFRNLPTQICFKRLRHRHRSSSDKKMRHVIVRFARISLEAV